MAPDVKAQVWAKTNGHCWYCGKLMNPWNDFTIDHMDPRKNGGGDELANLVPACQSCNSRKNAKNVEGYRMYLLEKQEVRFWGEHTKLLPLATESADEDDAYEGCEFCNEIKRSLRNATMTPLPVNDQAMLTLFVLSYINCTYAATVRLIANFSNQTIEAVTGHLLKLQQLGIITAKWQEQYNQHWYAVKTYAEDDEPF